MHTIAYRVRHKYSDTAVGITVPVELRYGENSVRLDAKIDTGAEFCLFQRGYGESLGIDIEAGDRKELRTANSTLVVFGHEVSLQVLGFEFSLVAFFPHDAGIRRCLLGRNGWLNRVRLGLVDYEQQIYLSNYSD